MTCDIFIKSYEADAEWLGYCIRSIDRHCSGFRRLVVVTPKDFVPRAKTLETVVLVRPDSSNGYLHQQATKLHADQITDANYILHVDSDNIFTRSVDPEQFMTEGRVHCLITPMKDVPLDARKAWIPVMQKFCGLTPEQEMMRRHPQLYPRWAYRALRSFCQNTHGVCLAEYIMRQPDRAFSEFNCMNFYVWLHHREHFTWFNTNERRHTPDCIRQFHSYDGVERHREEIEKLLAGVNESETVLSKG